MVNLAGFLSRRRWYVVGAWLVIVIVAAPLAAKQTEHLSGGGFDVPGSQSQAVETTLTKRFASNEQGRISLVLQPAPGITQEQAAAAVESVSAEVKSAGDGAPVPPEAGAQAQAQLAAGKPAIVPIAAQGDADELVNAATDLRDEISPGEQVDRSEERRVGKEGREEWSR